MSQTKVLLTGAQLPQTEQIYNALSSGQYTVFLADTSDLTGDFFVQIPLYSDSAFAHKILKLCLDNEFKVVIPQIPAEIKALAPAKTLFAEYGIALICPDKRINDLLSDLSLLYTTLQEEKVSVPAFRKVENVENFAPAMLQLGYPSKKIKVEPVNAAKPTDFRIVDDTVNTYGLLFPDPELPLISYTHLSKLIAADNFPPLVFSEFENGVELTYSADFSNGVLQTKSTEEVDLIKSLAVGIASILKLNGNFRFSFVQAAKGFNLIKLNWNLPETDKLLTFINNELQKLD
ncbi:hypothetical protein [Solitalea lacus]|uniref:hypothetical protein n=1 Tax=Solitalea lacus TaxID=2911172 RepID=UPI001EDABE63|nr:hypothetical protein [Solitalea lacus]UKJ06158.1 hypothetical protein L2B55_11470 [Solitalea lacus]